MLLFPNSAAELTNTAESQSAGFPGLKIGNGHFPAQSSLSFAPVRYLKRMIMHPPAPNYDLQLPASWGEHGSQTSQDRANCWNPTKVDRTGGKVRLHTVLWKRRQSICTFRIQFWIENRNCDNSRKNGVRICCAHGTFRCFELCSTCSREGLGRSKPATNPQDKHINTLWGFLLYPSLTEPSSIE